ncbi:MAG: alanine dehydrogenase [Chloroflexi bacterium]|jgi:alanine dehydrogenase|nr:alanine dehydrogenase [Chloroflexota bacterium]
MAGFRKTIGLPIMLEEEGEKRVFLPDFINHLVRLGFDVFLENNYGNSLGYDTDDYKQDYGDIKFVSRAELFDKDYILILRSPHEEEFSRIAPHSCLISMLHFPTRAARADRLKQNAIQAISLDSIQNDFGVRLVENMKAVAWNGIEAAFDEFEENYPHLLRNFERPWNVLIMGSGMVGKHAVDAATKFGKRSRSIKHMNLGGEGVIATTLGRTITKQPRKLREFFQDADLLVDTTQRTDASKPIVKNEWLAQLPEHAIIVDLSVDPYLIQDAPPVVKGIEGIPQGNLDQYIFSPNDPEWERTIPNSIPSKVRRKTISCYSWPGIHPEDCMRHYAQQLLPLMRVLVRKSYAELSSNGPFFERALFRARLDTYLSQKEN